MLSWWNRKKSSKSKDFQVDWKFIEKLEGFSLQGYVPLNRDGTVIGKSGVTVASGFDIGTRSIAELESLKLPHSLYLKLVPYNSARKKEALDLLNDLPLTLTQGEAETLNRACKAQHLSKLEALYDKASKIKFKDLPPEVQTVIASVSFQYGVGLYKACPKFWTQAIKQDYKAMFANLMNFGDDYTKRRHKEAAYLQLAINR